MEQRLGRVRRPAAGRVVRRLPRPASPCRCRLRCDPRLLPRGSQPAPRVRSAANSGPRSVPRSPASSLLPGPSLVMDPFAGSGAIGDACLAAGARSVWLNDLDPKSGQRTNRPAAKWTTTDFRRLRSAPGASTRSSLIRRGIATGRAGVGQATCTRTSRPQLRLGFVPVVPSFS